jgi:hypothetical protein
MTALRKEFAEAVLDLLYLLERTYPKRSSIDIVGNRYRLSADERMMLFRGIFTRAECEARTEKRSRWSAAAVDTWVIDGYNVFITLESYLTGRVVFRALDGFTRDITGVYGNYTFGTRTRRAAGLLVQVLKSRVPEGMPVFVYLDEPVSKSGEFARFLRDLFDREAIKAQVDVVRSPDALIRKNHAGKGDLVATSDTVLIDGVACCVDMPSLVLRGILERDILDIQDFMEEELPWVVALR